MNNSKQARDSNIELLRIILIAFVIGSHVISYGTLHPASPVHIGNLNFIPSIVFESIFIIAVNCFVLLSGYFGINATREKFAKLYSQIIFYSIAITLAVTLYDYLSGNVIEKKALAFSFIPFISKRWWFFTAYIILFIAAPFLNQMIEKQNKKQLLCIILISSFLFIIAPSFSFHILEGRGFNFVHFILLYFIGTYLRKYVNLKGKTQWLIMGYLATIILIIAYACLLDYINLNKGYITASFAYNNILVVLSAIALVLIFLNIKIKSNRIINTTASLVFGVYLFHEHPQLKFKLYDLFECNKYYDSWGFIPNLFLSIIVILILGLVIEWIRVKTIAKYMEKTFLTIINKILPKNIF